jgi:hypothetical protein
MTTKSKRTAQVWIGMVHVMPIREGALENATEAFTNALALVASHAEYEMVVKDSLLPLGFVVIEYEDVEPFASRALNWQVSDEMRNLAAAVKKRKRVLFGSFYTFRDEAVN